MSVEHTNAYSGPFTANGATTVFPFDFHAASAAEVSVEVDGLPLDISQFVVALSDDGTGDVTITPALASGEVYIWSEPDFTQLTSFQRFGPFYPDQTNAPLDRAAIRDIYLKDRLERVLADALIVAPQVAEFAFMVTDATQAVFVLPGTPPANVNFFLNSGRQQASAYTRVGSTITLVQPAVIGDVVLFEVGQASVQPTVALGNVTGLTDALIAAAGSSPSRDYAADTTGVNNAVAAFTSMFGADKYINLFDGTYRLNSDVSLTGPFAWDAHPDVAFLGAVVVDAAEYEGFNYTPDLRYISWARTAGTAAAPKTSPHAVAFVAANSNTPDTGGQPNPAFAVQHNMFSSTGEARAQAIYAEAIARVSGGGTFVEGIRSHGIVPDGVTSKAYGVLSYAQNGGTGANCIATESEIRRTSAVTVTTARDWVFTDTWDGLFLATANTNTGVVGGPGSRPNFGFALNMYSTIPVLTGFLIPKSLRVGGKTVDHTAFACLETGLAYGLDFLKGSYSQAVIAVPNTSAYRAANAAGDAEHNLLYYDSSNRLVLGEEAAAGVFIKGGVGFQGTSPISKPTVTGSRGANAALADLLTKLASYGLITDGTSA